MNIDHHLCDSTDFWDSFCTKIYPLPSSLSGLSPQSLTSTGSTSPSSSLGFLPTIFEEEEEDGNLSSISVSPSKEEESDEEAEVQHRIMKPIERHDRREAYIPSTQSNVLYS